MKAKVKATGKIVKAELDKCSVPVAGYVARSVYECSDGKKYFDTELDFINVFPDMQQVRIQASIAALKGLCSNSNHVTTEENYLIEKSIRLADKLVEKLQKEMEV